MTTRKRTAKKIESTTALAEHLGLSRWTVSRALNGHDGVKQETIDKVHQAMRELGFSPNPLARGLRGGKTGTIGICFQELDSPILAQKTSILQGLLREERYRALIELNNRQPDLEEEAIRHFMSMKVEGIILVGSTLAVDSPIVSVLKRNDIPTVAIDPESPLPLPTIKLDRREAMNLLFKHLHGLGHKRFALLGIDAENPYGKSRLEGFHRAAAEAGIQESDIITILEPKNHQHDYHYGERLATKLLREVSQRPTALLCVNDRVAIGAIRVFQKAGIKIPGQISITGYDNLDISDFITPKLTTIDQTVTRLMTAARDLLLNLVSAPEIKPETKLIEPVLIIRDSTAQLQPDI